MQARWRIHAPRSWIMIVVSVVVDIVVVTTRTSSTSDSRGSPGDTRGT